MSDFYDTFVAQQVPTRKKYKKPKTRKMEKLGYNHNRGSMDVSKQRRKSPWGDWHKKAECETAKIAKNFEDKKKNLRETVLTLTDTLITLYEDMPENTLLGKEDEVGDLIEFVAGRLDCFRDRYRRYY